MSSASPWTPALTGAAAATPPSPHQQQQQQHHKLMQSLQQQTLLLSECEASEKAVLEVVKNRVQRADGRVADRARAVFGMQVRRG